MSDATIVGCDVSQDWIDVFDARSSKSTRIKNRPKHISRWVGTLRSGTRVGMEATGTMHEELARQLAHAGHTVYVINPRWIHAYAKALGLRGKTDSGDAQLIARYVAAEGHHLHPYTPPSPEQAELRRLLLRRQEMVKLRAATRASLGAQATGVLEAFNRLIKDLERDIRERVRADAKWQAQARRMRTVPGVGPLVSAYLVQVLNRFPFQSADAFIAHSGTDPRPNDSGHKRGRRRLTHHGDAGLRAMLFMAAMGACKRPEWRKIYEHHRAKGLPSTGVLIILARKIARIAYGIFKHGYTYDASYLSKPISA